MVFMGDGSAVETSAAGKISTTFFSVVSPMGTKHGNLLSARRKNFLPLSRGSSKNFFLAPLRSGLAQSKSPCNGGIKPGGKASQLKSGLRFTPTGVTVAFREKLRKSFGKCFAFPTYH